MGSFHVPIEVGNLGGGALDRLEALVDTGATYTSVPRDLLQRLGVQADEQWPFILGDGREITHEIAWVRIRLHGRTQPTIAVFADPGSEPLLGVVTLEEFRLAVDPVNRRLLPVPALLKQLAAA
ncbi:MAG: retroviral-like aspartic protease family protein [Gemmatimonadetes bacterium]|nr:retroviral-like aspartic protease family protein [Gemmatimonadota bacterium]